MLATLKWAAIVLVVLLKNNIAIADLELSEIEKRIKEKQEFAQALDTKKHNFSEALSALEEESIKSEAYQQMIEDRITKKRKELLQQEYLSASARQNLQVINWQMKKQLLQSYLDENAGILAVLIGYQSFDDYTLSRHVAQKIAFKNAKILQEMRTAANRYNQQERKYSLLFQQLENARNSLKEQVQILVNAQQKKRRIIQEIAQRLDLTRQEIERLTARYENLSQVERDLEKRSAFKEKGIPISKWKGLLDWPAKGTVFLSDGEKNVDGFSVPLLGVFIQGHQGENVNSIFRGKIVFAGFMKGFGRTIIVDHGSAIHSVYAHLDRFAVTFGSLVSKGERIGYMGDTESTKGVQLYFELRRNGIPEDPAIWLRSEK
jgi:murein hydrolase activator